MKNEEHKYTFKMLKLDDILKTGCKIASIKQDLKRFATNTITMKNFTSKGETK